MFGRSLLAPALLGLALLAPGCVLAGAAGLAVVASQEFMDNAQTIVIEENVDTVWQATTSVFDDQSSTPAEIDTQLRAIQVNSRGTLYTAHVEVIDRNRTQINVGAMRYAVYQRELAEQMAVRIKKRVELIAP